MGKRVIITGVPGVGKTTVASALAHDPELINLYSDGVLWTSLGQQPNILSNLTDWEYALGISTSAEKEETDKVTIADEYVLVPIVSRGADVDSLFNLNRVGAFVWEQLNGKASGEQILEAMLERFEIDRPRAEADYLRFLAQLVSIRAVTRVSAAGQVRPTLR